VSFEVGDVIDGRYTVLGIVGRGGQGFVLHARDELLEAPVAIKCLHPSVAAEPGFKTRLLREAKAMGALSGTCAVQVLGFNKDTEAGMYIVMEFLEGRDFGAYLRDVERYGGPLSTDKLIELLGPVARTLDAAHARSIIHRDVKPANIFVLDSTARGAVRLLDFGLAKDLRADPLTQEGMVAGSTAYMAPEVWYGRPDLITSRIDVYSLATVIYRTLAGQTPFDATDAIDRFIVAVTRGPRPSLHAVRPDLPPAIDQWLEKALAIAPADRFESVHAMWSTLEAILVRKNPRRA
jgi:serine/threonine-protein kinase